MKHLLAIIAAAEFLMSETHNSLVGVGVGIILYDFMLKHS